MDDPHFADDFLAEEIDEFRGLRVAAVHERFHEKNVVLSRRVNDRHRFGVIQCQRFFAENMLTGLGGLEAPLNVRGVGRCDVDGLNLGIGEQRVVSAVATRYVVFCDEFIGARLRTAADGGELTGLGLGKLLGEDAGNSTGSQNTP